MTPIKDKKRILFVLPSLTPGGAERVLIMLMNDLDRKRFAPALVSLQNSGALRSLVNDDIPVTCLGAWSVPLSVFALAAKIRATKPEIVVSTMAHTNFAVLLLKPFFPKTRFIVREAITPSFLLQTHPAISWLLRLLYKGLYPMAHCVISPARLIMTEFEKDLRLPMRNHAWLPNPVDQPKIRQFGIAEKPEHKLRFIAAGRLHPQKGFDRLIAALKGFDPGCDWMLSILGDGAQKLELEDLIRKNGLENHVRLMGHVVTPWPHYAASDAFILCSRWEGLPNVVLESLASGTKVLALREAGGIEEIAELAPDSVKVFANVDSLVQAMKDVKPDCAENMRPSLLPETYEKESVNRAFLAIIDSV